MSYTEPRLTQYEPIDRAWIRLASIEDGWYMHITHAHRCGQPGDCESEQYTSLTLGEVLDVLDATLMTLGHGE